MAYLPVLVNQLVPKNGPKSISMTDWMNEWNSIWIRGGNWEYHKYWRGEGAAAQHLNKVSEEEKGGKPSGAGRPTHAVESRLERASSLTFPSLSLLQFFFSTYSPGFRSKKGGKKHTSALQRHFIWVVEYALLHFVYVIEQREGIFLFQIIIISSQRLLFPASVRVPDYYS